MFPDGTEPQYESVLWLQKKFMNWLNKERLRTILTFPVETVNLLDDGTDYVDKEFADFVAEMWSKGHSFFMYRSNSVDSLASCCYSKDTLVLIKDSKGIHKVTFEDIESMDFDDNGYKIFNKDKWSIGKLVKLPNRQMYKVTLENGKEMVVTDNHRNNVLGGMKRTVDLTTNDYLCIVRINKDIVDDFQVYEKGYFEQDSCCVPFAYTDSENVFYCKIKSIEKVDYDDYVYCFEMDDKNDDMFTLANGIHNYNCRLRNELQDNTFSYTLGAGGVSTGSKSVITINFNRLVQDAYKYKEWVNNNEFYDYLDGKIREQVRLVHKYLIAYDDNLKDFLKAKMLPIYDAGFINMDKQFLTIGVNGLIEGAEFLGIDISPNDEYFEYCTRCLKPIYEENKEAKTKHYMFNTEFVPKLRGYLVA